MKPTFSHSPAFGEASLSNCEREQIHLPGSIQPHGALLVFDEPDLKILQSSANVVEFLGLERDVQGQSAGDIDAALAQHIVNHRDDLARGGPAEFRCRVGAERQLFDCFLHRTGSSLIVEFFPFVPVSELPNQIREAIQTIHNGKSLQETCTDAAEVFYRLTGYDRVMVYRFDDEGHGQVVAEKFEKDLEPYLGNRYPASDIPQIARQLYLQNRVRTLVDVNYTPVRVEPRLSPVSGNELDMSMCQLRSISPIHVQYLKNMGVAGTLVVSIVVHGELWGLVSCHHYSRYMIPTSLGPACELIAESLGIRIAEYEAHVDAQADLAVRGFEAHLAASISTFGDWKTGVFDNPQHLLQPMEAGGAAVFIDGAFHTVGEVPGTSELRRINNWLSDKRDQGLQHTASLGGEDDRFSGLAEVASGLLAVPISPTPGERLIWFRPQQLRTDIWGGDPSKAVEMGDDPADLSPRRSFAKWYQEVEGTSLPWSSATRYIAERIGQSIGDAVLHNRSVRALIADDQLSKTIRQVGASELPVVIADSSRKILLANEAFHRLLPPGVPHLDRLEDLAQLFAEPDDFRRSLTDLCDRQREWRGEVGLLQGQKGRLDLMLRADSVKVSPNRAIGTLFMFMDLTEYCEAEAARTKLQEFIMSEASIPPEITRSDHSVMQRNLFSLVVGSAQTAAMEISNGVDIAKIPAMLESVKDSVARSARHLTTLMDHVADVDDDSSPD